MQWTAEQAAELYAMCVSGYIGIKVDKLLHKKTERGKTMNTITIELCAEDRARLDRIIAGLEAKQASAPEVNPTQNLDQMTSEEAIAEVASLEAEAAPSGPVSVTLSDIQQKVVALSAAGKKAQAREIVKAYAERVTLLPEDKYAEVMDKLSALDN